MAYKNLDKKRKKAREWAKKWRKNNAKWREYMRNWQAERRRNSINKNTQTLYSKYQTHFMSKEFTELKKAAMAFELKDGTILWIHEEDCQRIAFRLIAEGVCTGNVTLSVKRDTNVKKAQELHEILSREKGMPPELRVGYYEEILRLYKEVGEMEEVKPPQ